MRKTEDLYRGQNPATHRPLETAADRAAAGIDEPAEYAPHQEPPQNPDGGLPVALRGAPAPTKRARSSSPRKPRSPRKK